MKRVGRGVKIALIVLVSIPTLFILWTIFSIGVNYTCGIFKTMDIMNELKKSDDIEVLDNVTFVGNTSGAGNHTEVRSTVLINSSNEESIIQCLGSDLEYSFIHPLFQEVPEEMYDRWSRELEIPYDTSKCYVVEVYTSVPFRDSILGH